MTNLLFYVVMQRSRNVVQKILLLFEDA